MKSIALSSDNQLELRLPCRPEFVRTVRRVVSDFAYSCNVPASVVEEIEVAASEAVTNVVRHAYPDPRNGAPMLVRCRRRGTTLSVEVVDRGRGFQAPPGGAVPDPDIERDGGFGIILIRNLMDTVKYVSRPDAGTRIRMTKRAREIMSRAGRAARAPSPR